MAGKPATKVTVQEVPCVVTSMAFYDKITNEKNGIVRKGRILECMEEQINGFYVNDKLRALLLDPDSDVYQLYSAEERQQFAFLLLMHFTLGGLYCQQEFHIDPYLETVKQVYKELLRK
ncbi:hypothetical protein O3M35_010936 [Rhynocoris fuscipes]|uniref:Cilia- and flagella-associated protein 300 n=1 Tax=Rhynocoris fuscipes TaxID=488301 RepID=A0AAW1D114_9HEMI